MKEKHYTFGFSPGALNVLQQRTAEREAGFLLPKLNAGMHVLDTGSGPGAITLGLAEGVDPGRVIGVDIESSQVETARQLAESKNLKNLQFEVGDVTQLRFEDASFDVVYGHTILMQFEQPDQALTEAARVLKPGGIVAYREMAGLWVIRPINGARQRYKDLFISMVKRNGGNPSIGADLGALLHAHGFTEIEQQASFSSPATPEQRAAYYGNLARLCREAVWMDEAVELGWLSSSERDQLAQELVAEGQDPSAFFATAYCEALAVKPTTSV